MFEDLISSSYGNTNSARHLRKGKWPHCKRKYGRLVTAASFGTTRGRQCLPDALILCFLIPLLAVEANVSILCLLLSLHMFCWCLTSTVAYNIPAPSTKELSQLVHAPRPLRLLQSFRLFGASACFRATFFVAAMCARDASRRHALRMAAI